MPRQRVPIPFGRGLARGSGSMVVDPGDIIDLRNVYLSEGKALVRLGMEETALFLDDAAQPVSDIVGIHPQRTERIGIVVGYQSTSGKIFVYRVTSEGQAPVLLDCDDGAGGSRKWWHQIVAGSPPPIIQMADSYQYVFIAHDEPFIVDRGPTVYYSPLEGTPIKRLLLDLAVPLSGTTSPVRFRSVARHLAYIFAAGWGAPGDEDRPEMVRHCLPANPLSFSPNHYQLIGQRGEPVIGMVSTPAGLVCGKPAALHSIFGYDRTTFGNREIDPVYGPAGGRLMIAFRSGVAFWSTDGGPRWTNGGAASEPMERDQLELLGLEPDDLVAPEDVELGFACNLVTRKVLYFFFGRRGYALHYGTQPSEWSYDERAVPLMSAGELFFTDEGGAVGAPTGHPEWIAPTDTTHNWEDAIGDFQASPNVRNVGAIGGEVLEVWLKPAAGVWTAWQNYNVNALSPVQQLVPALAGLTANTTYDVAYRYRRGGEVTAGYESASPDNWPAISKGQFTTTLLEYALQSAIWERTGAATELIHLTWSGGPVDSVDIEKSTDGVSFTAVTTVGSGITTYDYAVLVGEPETYLWFRVKPDSGTVYSNVIKVWVGPVQPSGWDEANNAQLAQGAAPHAWHFELTPGVTGGAKGVSNVLEGIGLKWVDQTNGTYNILLPDTEIELSVAHIAAGAFQLRATVDSAGGPPNEWTCTPLPVVGSNCAEKNNGALSTTKARIRHKVVQFATTDFSDYSAEVTIIP